jgi:Tfp pilus assembly protein PilO
MEIHKPITIIIFLILTVILTFLFVVPKYQEYQELTMKILESHAQYSGESIYYARVSDVLLGLETRKEVLDKIQGSLPNSFSLGPVVDFIQQKGTENNVKITSVMFSQISPLSLDQVPYAKAVGEIKNSAFTASVTGSYQGLKNFLSAMDNSARLFEMDSVSFSKIDSISTARNRVQEYVLKLEVKTHSY